MKISVILAHPDPQSFNANLAATVCDELARLGHAMCFHDLYAEGFDPLLCGPECRRGAVLPEAVERHCKEIAEAEGIVIVHPNWWGMPPAILKGWIDRVIRPGVAYEFREGDKGEGVPVGLLKARAAVVLNTSNTSSHREYNVFGDPLQRIWKDCVFGLCGVPRFYRKMFRVVATSSERQRQTWLEETREITAKYFPAAVE